MPSLFLSKKNLQNAWRNVPISFVLGIVLISVPLLFSQTTSWVYSFDGADNLTDDGLSIAYGADFAPWSNPVEGKTCDIPQGFAIVENTVYCGKDCGLTVYMGKSIE